MTLTTRLTTLFLAALALVLVAFSVNLYLLANFYLDHQTEERVENALDTLAAAIDGSEGYLEWEGHERQLTLGKDTGWDQVRWTVHAADGNLLAKSDNLNADELGATGRWRLAHRLVRAHAHASARKGPPSNEKARKHLQLRLTTGISLDSQDATLRNLAGALLGLCAIILAMAAFAGRWLCRRALAPVTAIAKAARNMSAADLDARLPAPGTADELADVARAFNDLLARLQEAFLRQRRFSGDASHQLRTPLAALIGQVEVALRRDRTLAEYREALGRVLGQGQHMQQVVESLLFLARADAETRLHNLQQVNFADWLPNHLLRWRDHPRWPDLRVEAQSCCVFAQPALLGQLIDNLLENACNYSEAGTPISVGVGRHDDCVTVSVEDGGVGIAAEEIPHLFEPFFRSARTRRDGKAGVGLGLAVAQRIAAAFGARLELDKSSPSGSRFVLRLPSVSFA